MPEEDGLAEETTNFPSGHPPERSSSAETSAPSSAGNDAPQGEPAETELQATEAFLTADSCRSTVCSPQSDRSPSPGVSPGRRIGDYELLEKLAEGGMGAVYRARHVRLQRIVALKMIKTGVLAGEEEIRRFLAEAEAVAQLDHPGIVPLYEVGQWKPEENASWIPFLAMGFVEGESLAERLREGPMPPQQAAWITLQMAEAMQYAHDKGIIHRDLKPANVLLQKDGERSRTAESTKSLSDVSSLSGQMPFFPRITDFGLAKRLDGDSQMTRTGQVMGTPSYMPPEQARGDISQVGPLADVYSLGATLYALLVGRPPFQAASVLETLKQVLEQEPISPRSLNAAVDKDLETICLKCLEKDPEKRYGSARELAEDLDRFLRGHPISARPVGKVERLWRWCRRNRALAAVGATALVLLLTLSIGGPLVAFYQAELKNQATEAAQAEKLARQQAFRYYYAAQMNLIQQDWEQNNIAPLVQRLEATRPEQTGGEDLRGFEWYFWQRLCRSELLTLSGHADFVFSVAFSPDGRHLASGGRDSTIRMWDVVTGKVVRTLQGHTDSVTCVVFHPDGRQLASASEDGTIKLWDAASGRERLTLKGHAGEVLWIRFSPDGRYLASASLEGPIKLWDAASGQERLTLKGHSGEVWSVAFSPDGRQLASAGGDETIKLWDVATGRERLTLKGHNGGVRSVAFSPEGKRLVSAGEDRSLRLWSVESGEELMTLRGHLDEVAHAVFSPDGSRLASASFDGTVKLWDATLDPQRIVLSGHTDAVNCVAFHPRGRYLASASRDRTVRVWDLHTTQQRHLLGGHPSFVHAVAFDPRGRHLASGSWNQIILVWDAASGAQRLLLRGRGNVVSSVAFSPDGRHLATAGGNHFLKGGELNVWDVATGEQLLSFFGRTEFLSAVTFSPDGKRLALVGWNRTVQVWDAATGEELLAVSKHAGHVNAVAFSPDGSRIATAGDDGTIRVWDAATGQQRLTLSGHRASVRSVGFSADGTRLVSAGADETIKVWDALTGHVLLTLRGHTGGVSCAAFAPGGKRLASAGEDGTVQLWDARPWTPQRRVQFEALGLVRFLLQTKGLSPQAARAWLQNDRTRRPTVKEEALRLLRLRTPAKP